MRSAPAFRLLTSRLARVVYASVVLASVSLVSVFYGKPHVWAVDEVPVAFWAWRTEAPNAADINAAVEKTHAQVFFLRAGQIDIQNGNLRRIRPLAGTLPKGIKLHLVYNTTRLVLDQLESLNSQTLADEIARDYREDAERARCDGADLRGLQIDIDFPTRLLPRYEQTLIALRKELPSGTELSTTGLPTWMEAPALPRVLENVDFWVPQFYGGEIPTHLGQTVPISSPESITYFVNKARQLDKPFYAGLAAYSVTLVYDISGSLISLRGDMNPALIASDPNLELTSQESMGSAERRYVFRARAAGVTDSLNMRAGDVLVVDLPSSETLRSAARTTRKLAGKRLLGICVFRLPISDDPATLTIEQMTAALNDRDSHAAIEVRLKRDTQHELVLECRNGGTASPIIGSLKVDLSVPAGSFEAIRPQPGVTIQPLCGSVNGLQPCSERRADVLRLSVPFLAPGQTLTTTLLLNREPPPTTSVSVGMQTETEQSYSARSEVRIEAGVK